MRWRERKEERHVNMWAHLFCLRILYVDNFLIYVVYIPLSMAANAKTAEQKHTAEQRNTKVKLPHDIETSIECWQLWLSHPLWRHWVKSVSRPVHATSSSKIVPLPAPYLFPMTSPLYLRQHSTRGMHSFVQSIIRRNIHYITLHYKFLTWPK